MIPVSEIFYSIQGEGVYTGTPSIFIRTIGCNLRCVFKGSICDTAYTSFHPESPKYKSIDEIFNRVMEIHKEYPNVFHIVITGGEPLLYRDSLFELIRKLKNEYNNILTKREPIITIETNGTLPGVSSLVDLYSISPKLHTSEASDEDIKGGIIDKQSADKHKCTRYNIESLGNLISQLSDYQLKFVYSGPECIQEIEQIINDLVIYKKDHCVTQPYDEHWYRDEINSRILIMPEGVNLKQIMSRQEECVNVCLKHGWRYCDRLHIRIWGSKRGV